MERYGATHAVEGDLVLVSGVRHPGASRARSRPRRGTCTSSCCSAPALTPCAARLPCLQDGGDRAAAADEADGEGGAAPAEADVEPAAVAALVRHVTAEEAAARSVPITDVVLPLASPSSVYPSNASGDVYRTLSDKDGVSLQKGAHAVRFFSIESLTGGRAYPPLRPLAPPPNSAASTAARHPHSRNDEKHAPEQVPEAHRQAGEDRR